MNDAGFRVIEAMDKVAERTGASHTTIALAWLLAQPAVVSPIASASRPQHIAELVAAPALRLSHEDLDELSLASSTELPTQA